MNHHGSDWMDFCEILCCGLEERSVEKLQIRLKTDKNIRRFTGRPKYKVV
jgi:hypothetical protein